MSNTRIKKVFLLFFFMNLLSLTGCREDPEIHHEGFFEYIILKPGKYWYKGENESIAIVGFTESGLKEETIKIPEKINGIPVEHIGYSSDNGAYSKTYIFNPKICENDSIKNIYFYNNVLSFTTIDCDWNLDNVSRELNVFNCSKNTEVIPIFAEKFNFYWYNIESLNSFNKYSLPNIVYSYNKNSDNYYFLDNALNGDTLIEPEKPAYDGYVFTGWFCEPECINKYNFQETVNIEKGEHLFLYAGWNK